MKRGISGVVATILIILIAIAAVTIVWTMVIPMIQEDVEFEEQLVDLSINTFEGYTVWDEANQSISIHVKRGGDDVELSGIQFIFSKEGRSITRIIEDVPGKNQAKVYNFNLSIFGQPYSVSVAPIFAEGNTTGNIVAEVENIPEGEVTGSLVNVTGIIYYYDGDGDGYSSGETFEFEEGQNTTPYYKAEHLIATSGDCNDAGAPLPCAYTTKDDCDTAPSGCPICINPGAIEYCDDDIDNDCDGKVDLDDIDCHLGLVAWWRFNDGTAVDETGINDGTLMGGTNCTYLGTTGFGCYFDGINDYIDLPTGNLPYNDSSRTMCAWGKTDTISDFSYHWVVAYGSPGIGDSFFIGRYYDDLSGGGYGDDITYASYWNVGTWNHVCLVYNGTQATLYSHGNFLTSAAKLWTTMANVAYIGKQTNGGEYWNGSVDDVMIFDRVLSQSEIWDIYISQGGAPPPPP